MGSSPTVRIVSTLELRVSGLGSKLSRQGVRLLPGVPFTEGAGQRWPIGLENRRAVKRRVGQSNGGHSVLKTGARASVGVRFLGLPPSPVLL